MSKKTAPIAMKLGKLPPRIDPRTLRFARYLSPGMIPPALASVDWSTKVPSWGMMLNDFLGDCTCAAAGHCEMLWTANAGREFTPSDDDILAAYEAVGGYKPGEPDTDNGAFELDVLKYWRETGIAGRRIAAFAAVNPLNHDHLKLAVMLFGAAYIGVALPVSAQGQEAWDVPPGGAKGEGEPGSWGGHAVPIVGYDPNFLTVVTWGATKKMTWAFLDAYCDEAYAVLSGDFIGASGIAPSGFNFGVLQADLQLVSG
jgi:hypothetical protein